MQEEPLLQHSSRYPVICCCPNRSLIFMRDSGTNSLVKRIHTISRPQKTARPSSYLYHIFISFFNRLTFDRAE